MTKVYYNGKRIHPRGSNGQFKKSAKNIGFILAVIAVAGCFGAVAFSSSSTTVVASTPIIRTVEVVSTSTAPILQKIAICESGNEQFGKDGQVLLHANDNHSVDVGRYMINEQIWGAQATKLGFNLFTDEGNKDMAQWLFLNKGSTVWVDSSACWNR